MGRAVVVNAQVDPMVDTDPNGERDTVVWGAVEYLADENDGKIMVSTCRDMTSAEGRAARGVTAPPRHRCRTPPHAAALTRHRVTHRPPTWRYLA